MTGLSDSEELQCLLNGGYLNRGSGSGIIDIKATVVHKNSFSLPSPYEFYCPLMNEVPENLGDMFKYDFSVWDSQAMKDVGNKSMY